MYLLKGKSEADVFEIDSRWAEEQLERAIKVVRSNGGGEYYGWYDGSGRVLGSFGKILRRDDISP